MLIHRNCNGVVLEKENDRSHTRLWSLCNNAGKDVVVYEFKKEIDLPNVHCLKCNKTWTTVIEARIESRDFSLLAEKNLKIIFTTIILGMIALFWSTVYIENLHTLKGVVYAVVALVGFIIVLGKDFCEMIEILNSVNRIYKKYGKQIK